MFFLIRLSVIKFPPFLAPDFPLDHQSDLTNYGMKIASESSHRPPENTTLNMSVIPSGSFGCSRCLTYLPFA